MLHFSCQIKYVIKNVLCHFEITCRVALSFLKTISCFGIAGIILEMLSGAW